MLVKIGVSAKTGKIALTPISAHGAKKFQKFLPLDPFEAIFSPP